MQILRWAGRLWIGVLSATTFVVGLLFALRLLLPLFSSAPVVQRIEPSDGSTDVLPRSQVQLQFSEPMNPRSVERALRIDPPIDAVLRWNEDRTTLIISPTRSLQPAVQYRVQINDVAQSQLFHPLEESQAFSFQVAPAPAVLSVLPSDQSSDVALDSPISITFSRPIVPTDTVLMPRELPELQFDPPVDGTAIWLDSTTVLYRPNAPLLPGTTYQATLTAQLSDVGGGVLGRDVSWSFRTPAPKVLSTTPSVGARWVAPRTPLTLRLAHALDPNTLSESLTISPTLPVQFEATLLPDATQLITFTPTTDWKSGTNYSAVLRLNPEPDAPEVARWNFTVTPQPAVIGRFPGEGQVLPAGQDIRLIFNTPVDSAALQEALTVTPEVSGLRVSVNDVEARISAELRAATVYTVTLPSSLLDRNGVPLGRDYLLRFMTSSASSSLSLLDTTGHVLHVRPDQEASVNIRRINVSALNLDLYRLDEATSVRAMAFEPRDWRDFQPERYGQPLLREWVVPLTDTLNVPTEERLPITLEDGSPLDEGIYYLRIRTPEGPRIDVMLLRSRVRLTFQASPSSLLLWATDVISATPVADLPLVLYQDGALIQQGVTDANGRWLIERAGGTAGLRYIVMASNQTPTLASSTWADAVNAAPTENYRVWLTTDRAAYQAGETLEVAGVVRRAVGQRNSLLSTPLLAQLTVRSLSVAELLHSQQLFIDTTGVFSATFALPDDVRPGEYIVGLAISGAVFHTTFAVRAESTAPLDLQIAAPTQVVAGNGTTIPIDLHTWDARPIASAAISWTLSAERMPFPALADYSFGDDELNFERPQPRSGLGLTDADGHYLLTITDTLNLGVPLRYRLAVRASEPGGAVVDGDAILHSLPALRYAGVRLPQRVLMAGQPGVIEAIALNLDGLPALGTPVEISVYKREWLSQDGDESSESVGELTVQDRRVLLRVVSSNAEGKASLPITLEEPGEYRVFVSVIDDNGRRMTSATSLWVAGPGFTAWPGTSPRLLADRTVYRVGDTASLLLRVPHADGTALLTFARADTLVSEVRSVRAGEPITVTITPEDAPGVRVAVLLVSPADADSVPAVSVATTTLPVMVESRPVNVQITTDQVEYAPDSTATLTITTTDAQGQAIPAHVMLSVAGANAAPRGDIASSFFVNQPPALATGWLPSAPSQIAPMPTRPSQPVAPQLAARPAHGVYWDTALRTNDSGVLTITLRLPNEAGAFRAVAWAFRDADSFGQGQASFTISQSLDLTIDAPQLLRHGDSAELVALVRNTSTTTQTATLAFISSGLRLIEQPSSLNVELASGELARVVWRVAVDNGNRARFRIDATDGAAFTQTQERELPIEPTAEPLAMLTKVGVLREYLDPLTKQSLEITQLRAGQLVRVRLTLINTAHYQDVLVIEPLPGGARLVEANTPSFGQLEVRTEQLRLHSSALTPGIYQYEYLLRVGPAGRYIVPMSTLSQANEGLLGSSQLLQLEVVAP